MTVLFNNCGNRQHARLFPSVAFFDLYNRPPHAGLAKGLIPGTECLVASKVDDATVRFTWFRFTHERIETPKGEEEPVRVFYGEELRSQTMPKAEAAGKEPFAAFFDRRGHFKQQSVVRIER
jgi:hypothetical protein